VTANCIAGAKSAVYDCLVCHAYSFLVTVSTKMSCISKLIFFQMPRLFLLPGGLRFTSDWATVCKTVRPMLSDRRPVCLSVTLVYCGRTVGRIKMKLGTRVGLCPGHIVLDGDPAHPLPKGHSLPNFRPMSHVVKRLDKLRRHLIWR